MMAEFLISFVEKYPQFEGRDFYITGESYAGHYVPAISHNLAFQHKEDLKLNLKGLAIGNGLVAPISQYPEYATFAKDEKLIGEAEYLVLKGAFLTC
jgi:carboxypeptidase C (cathepsin A)